MKKIRFGISMLVGKISIFLLGTVLGRGTNMPGKFMLKICPDILSMFKMPETVICVTGTNGKTGTSNLLTSILRSAGKTVVNNSKGSNMAPGLITALAADSTLSGRVKSDVAVLEVDERSSQFIYTKFTPTYVLCTNLFRDSIMRNGHSGFIFDKINDYLSPDTTMVLNGNDGISGMLGDGICKKRVFFAVEKTSRCTDKCMDAVCDLLSCPSCHHLLTYDYFHYNHMGNPHCENCGFKLPDPDFKAYDVNFDDCTFMVSGKDEEPICLPYQKGNFFNVFNITGVYTICRLIGIDQAIIEKNVKDISSKTGRFVASDFGGIAVTSMLSKNQNPISCSQSIRYLNSNENDKDVVLLITDSNDNKHGHEDISWIYDTDFSPLSNDHIKNIYIGGSRAYDLANCLEIKGLDTDKFIIFTDYDELAKAVCDNASPERDVVIYFELYATRVVKAIKETFRKGAKK